MSRAACRRRHERSRIERVASPPPPVLCPSSGRAPCRAFAAPIAAPSPRGCCSRPARWQRCPRMRSRSYLAGTRRFPRSSTLVRRRRLGAARSVLSTSNHSRLRSLRRLHPRAGWAGRAEHLHALQFHRVAKLAGKRPANALAAGRTRLVWFWLRLHGRARPVSLVCREHGEHDSQCTQPLAQSLLVG
eukprot:SAG31_NODE_2717_length_5194_cov_2.227085_3_plen_188_part_00